MTSTKSSGKTRTAPPEVRRNQLINATITCIARKGISGTTLSAIGKEAGLSLGLANFHFKSKDALLSETLRCLAAEHRDMWQRDAKRDDISDIDKLHSIVSAQFHPRICSRKKLAVWFAFFGEACHRKTYRSISSQIDMERQELCAELINSIADKGGLKEIDAEQIALTLEGLFDGAWLNMLMYPAKFTREEAERQVLDYLGLVLGSTFGADFDSPVSA
ncbi:TetR family transcriptional regulator C-terminal domain-containing protein [Aliiroseovarius sp. KMU-50]|uniref:TetR family transcriptional regulator C-terminal domain-containing protein n=1 Tax=Aliiroseovarius salicola TaxID=3009082 RepID=A0ABT4VZJ8_9RHOB|nr:TetR family transcriptional regulator C-terminal domain-containing protein [Aliiroseovarius sp. KMU-50]MDA5093690.1 TetR family transcriptional regulator C-terminal domain-containing protein [Aliiroseovarius sp. KMU-50]